MTNIIMQISKNEILFIYNSNDFSDRQALGYAKSLPNHRIKEIDLNKSKFSELQVKQIADVLEIDPVSLIDHKSDVYKKTYSQVELTRKGALKAMATKPELIKTPIALYNDQARPIETPYEMIKWEMTQTSALKEFASISVTEILHDQQNQVFFADLGKEQMTLEYTRTQDVIDFTSTYVPKNYRNQGRGRRLVNFALEYAKQEGLEVKATCPFVADILEEKKA